jgi:hypothetical protein
MNLPFFLRWLRKKPAPPVDLYIPRCQCRKSRSVTPLVEYDRWPLRDESHTVFKLLRCDDCGKICGFPDYNLTIAIAEGTPETLSLLHAAAVNRPKQTA